MTPPRNASDPLNFIEALTRRQAAPCLPVASRRKEKEAAIVGTGGGDGAARTTEGKVDPLSHSLPLRETQGKIFL
jgi:hypothetical protein